MFERISGKEAANSFGRVAVLMGGWSRERDISLRSGQAVLASLQRAGVDAFALELSDGAGFVELAGLDRERCDRAFIALHGRGGEDGVVQGALEALRVPYTGSGVLGSALAMNKIMSKRLWRQMGLPTPGFLELAPGFVPEDVIESLGLPLAVKPALEGSSLGVSRVESAAQLPQAWEEASRYDCPVIAERWIEGEEYAAGFIGDRVLTPVKLEYGAHEFYDYHAKYEDGGTRYLCPDGLSLVEIARVQALAWRAADALGVTGWGRADLRRDRAGKFWLLEVNTAPGMTEHSLVPKAAQAEGMDFDRTVLEILATSLNGEERR